MTAGNHFCIASPRSPGLIGSGRIVLLPKRRVWSARLWSSAPCRLVLSARVGNFGIAPLTPFPGLASAGFGDGTGTDDGTGALGAHGNSWALASGQFPVLRRCRWHVPGTRTYRGSGLSFAELRSLLLEVTYLSSHSRCPNLCRLETYGNRAVSESNFSLYHPHSIIECKIYLSRT